MNERSYSDIRYDIERYENTINLTLLCKNFINEKFEDIDFFPPEESFYIVNQKAPITPDFSFLKKDKSYGIICEIKAGLPKTNEYLEKTIEKVLERYLSLRQGWNLNETEFRNLNYSLLFIVQFQQIVSLKAFLIDYNKQKPFKKLVSVWDFSISETQYGDGYRFLRFRHYCGKSGINKLDEEANTGYKMLESDLNSERQLYLFTTEPPIEYSIIVIWTYVLSFFAYEKNKNEFTTSIDEVYDTIKENFMNWAGKKSLLKRSWIVNAFNKMVDYKLIEKDEKNQIYMVDYKKRQKKNILKIIEEKIKRSSEIKKKPPIKKKVPQKKIIQKKINDIIKKEEKKKKENH